MITAAPRASEEYTCPYWAGQSKYCLLSREGLYLPLGDHVIIYCQTINHHMCPFLINRGGEEERGWETRRGRRRNDRW